MVKDTNHFKTGLVIINSYKVTEIAVRLHIP